MNRAILGSFGRTVALPTLLLLATPLAEANPTGGSVVAGGATIDVSGNTVTVTQGSERAIITWEDFSNAAGERIRFIQPDAASATLNRVVSGQPSALFGDLEANGRVYLINPNGILVGAGARLDTGGFLASTLDVVNQDFLAGGDLRFSGDSTAAVQNLGTINALGGDVFLIARSVENTGTVTAAHGSAGLAAGSEILLTTGGDERLFVQAASVPGTIVSAGTISATQAELKAAGGNAYALAINHSGLVRATGTAERGGKLWLVAEGGDIATTGTLDASSATGPGGDLKVTGNHISLDTASRLEASGATGGGTIYVLGDAQTTVAGTLVAEATTRGDGGFIETSAGHVQVADTARISTAAAAGSAGTWLIDPVDFTIAASGGDMTGTTLTTNLGSGNVTIQSSSGSAGTAGDVNVNDTVSWSANKLTLNAQNNINVRAALKGSGTASLAFEYGQASSNGGSSDYLVNGAITLPAGSNFSTKLGSSGAVKTYTVITSLGAAGSTTGTDLQGINGALTANYALGADIDATATSDWNNGAFLPIGGLTAQFTGTFTGLGHAISGLTINRPSTAAVGLFGYAATGAVIRNVGLVGGSVSGSSIVGSLVGLSNATIANSYATGSVSATSTVGGLVGSMNAGSASVTNSYATGSVSATSSTAGGLVGSTANTASITNSYATGSVSATSSVGGLVGSNGGSSGATTITNSYATGNVSATGSNVGGLIGSNSSNATVTNSYWNKDTTGRTTSAAGTGLTTVQMRTASNFAGFTFTTTPGATGNAWVMVDTDGTLNNAGSATGAVFPMLASEYSTTVTNPHQVQLMAMNLGATYTLPANLDLAVTGNSKDVWNSTGFVPVGNSSTAFTGTFDGLSHTLSNLKINRALVDYVGLFGYTATGSTIKNVGLVGGSVSGHDNVGHLVGSNGGSISNSYATGSVSGNSLIAGLVGINRSDASITDSYATGNVTATAQYAGGLVGNNFGAINRTYATGSVTGTVAVGGLAGNTNGLTGTTENSFWNKEITASVGDGGRGLTAAQLKTQANFTSATAANGNTNPNWNFASTWVMYEGQTAPLLRSFLTPLTVTASNDTKTSGGAAYSGGNGVTYSVTPNNSNLLGTVSYSGTSQGATAAGSYVITPGGLYSNQQGYLISYANGTLTLEGGSSASTTSALTITADNASRSYGAANPAFTASYAGFINGDTSSVVTGLQFSTMATTGSNVGTYTITPYGATAPSTYSLSYISGVLTINPALLTITAANASRTYGAANPAFTASYAGLSNGDTAAVVSGLQFSTTATAGSSVGTYAITPSGATAANYSLAYVSGQLTVNPALLTVTAADAEREYGRANPDFTAGYSGWVNGDTAAIVSGLQFSTGATATSGIGDYAITPSGATAANYQLAFVDGTLRVVTPMVSVGGGVPAPVFTVGTIPALTSTLAVVTINGNPVLMPVDSQGVIVVAAAGTSGSLDAQLGFALADATGSAPVTGGLAKSNQPNFGSFQFVATGTTGLAGVTGSGSGPESSDESDLIRETSISQGGYNIIYHEALTVETTQTVGSTTVGSSYREFLDTENPEINLVRPTTGQSPAGTSAGGSAGASL